MWKQVSQALDNPILPGGILVSPPGGQGRGFPTLLRQDYLQQLREAGYKEEELDSVIEQSIVRYYWQPQRPSMTFLEYMFSPMEGTE